MLTPLKNTKKIKKKSRRTETLLSICTPYSAKLEAKYLFCYGESFMLEKDGEIFLINPVNISMKRN